MEVGMGVAVTGGLCLGLVGLLLCWFRRTRSQFQTIEKMGLPGPRPSLLGGNMNCITTKGFGAAFKDWEKEFGPVYGIYRAKQASIVVHDPDMLREMMVKQFEAFPNRAKTNITNRWPLCDMLQFTEDEHWRHVRKTLSVGFSSGKLKSMMPVIQRSCRHLSERVAQLAKNGQEVDIKDLCNAWSMEVTAGTGFGLEVNCVHNPGEPFTQRAKRLLYPPHWRFTLLFLFPALGDLLNRLGLGVFSRQDTDYFFDVIRRALTDRRQDRGPRHKDFLQSFVESEREGTEEGEGGGESELDTQLNAAPSSSRKGLTEREIEANCLNFLLAGYENTASAMAFLLYNLAGSPQCLAKLQREVDSVLGQDEVDYRVVMDMPYLDMCLNESLRLYPPGIMVDRMCVKDTKVKGLHVPKGMLITIPVYSLHTDPAHWPDPFTFDPERHTAEARAARHQFSFLPFGLGPRNCIGMRLSQMEVKMAVVAIVQKFSPVLCEKSVFPAQISNHIRLGPVETMWVKFLPRSA
ncbi:cytochrome P450 3A9-like [Babylonia areolata]|uniref:cytochrome P450 3A9-like n=1 Tax=Babylonia areolata TaxID=304850 RepID=UPI003FD088BD